MTTLALLACLPTLIAIGACWLARESHRGEQPHESDVAFDTLPTNVRAMPGIPAPRTPSRWS